MSYSRTPLRDASYLGDVAQVQSLLSVNPSEVSSKDSEGMTPLHVAARKGHKEVVELLLANGSDVHAKAKNGTVPLHEAAGGGRKEVVELLLANGADVDAKAKNGETPLHEAVRSSKETGVCRKEAIELLLANGAEVDAKDNGGRTPLYYANKEVAELLFASGADAQAVPKQKRKEWLQFVFAAPLVCSLVVAFVTVVGHTGPWTRGNLQFFAKIAGIAFVGMSVLVSLLWVRERVVERSPSLRAGADLTILLFVVAVLALSGWTIKKQEKQTIEAGRPFAEIARETLPALKERAELIRKSRDRFEAQQADPFGGAQVTRHTIQYPYMKYTFTDNFDSGPPEYCGGGPTDGHGHEPLFCFSLGQDDHGVFNLQLYAKRVDLTRVKTIVVVYERSHTQRYRSIDPLIRTPTGREASQTVYQISVFVVDKESMKLTAFHEFDPETLPGEYSSENGSGPDNAINEEVRQRAVDWLFDLPSR